MAIFGRGVDPLGPPNRGIECRMQVWYDFRPISRCLGMIQGKVIVTQLNPNGIIIDLSNDAISNDLE